MSKYSTEEQIVLAAWMYYSDGLTQAQIATKLGISRISVTRLLKKARNEGIVQIRITKPRPTQFNLERSLEETFGLERAIVVRTAATDEETLDAVGRAGAEHMLHLLSTGCRLGIGWSRTVSRIAPFLHKPQHDLGCTVNELAGSLLGLENPYSISGRIAQILEVPVETLPVPAIVQNPTTRTALLQEDEIRSVLENARKCDAAFVGLGEISSENTMVRTGYMTREQMDELRRKGAVGEVLLRYFDSNGDNVPNPLEDRIISLDWESIRRIPYIVIMALGPGKVDALVGALNGLFHCLITDTFTATILLDRKQSGDSNAHQS
ncbi:MAG: sugar-binding transcriptional regulator [Anaerolineales bacterium]|nr:sugar-binding transcriptional regulator [Anaerolineales bacterium]